MSNEVACPDLSGKSQPIPTCREFISGKKLNYLTTLTFRQKGKIIVLIFTLFIFNSSLLIPNCMCQWVPVSNGMGTNRSVNTLAYSGNNIFAGTDLGIYLSTDSGSNWSSFALSTRFIWSLAVNGNNIFAGTASYGIYLSTNNGTSWTQTSVGINRFVYSFAVNGNNVFAGTDLGVYLSTDNGINWAQTSLNNRTIQSLALNGNNVFAGTSGITTGYGVYVSTNNGTSWTQSSLNNRSVYALAVNGNNIFAGIYNTNGTTTYGVYLSTDNGATWTQTPLNNKHIFSLLIFGNNIFAGTGAGGVYVSTNNGASWTPMNQGLGNITVWDLCIFNNYLFAGISVSPYGVYRRPLSELITGINTISNQTPKEFSLSQNYPNPFNPSTKIHFEVPATLSFPHARSGNPYISLVVYDITGKDIATLVNEQLNPGTYEVTFDGSNLPSGIYFYQLKSESFSETKKLSLLK